MLTVSLHNFRKNFPNAFLSEYLRMSLTESQQKNAFRPGIKLLTFSLDNES